jgi:hypothetical protein
MSNQSLAVLDATGLTKNIDMESTADGDFRQPICIGGKSVVAAIAEVVNTALASGAYGLAIRRAPTGLPWHRLADGTSGDKASIKGTPGVVHHVSVFSNNPDYPVFVKFYDKASAPNPVSDTPVWVVGVQAGVPRDVAPPASVAFSIGIAVAIVKGIAQNDNTSVAASDCIVNVFWE